MARRWQVLICSVQKVHRLCPHIASTHATHRPRSAASLEGTHATLLGELIVRKNMIATKRKTPALAQKPMCPAHAQPSLDGRRGSKVGCLNPKS